VGRAREGNIGGSSGTGGPSGVIAQTDLSRGPWPIAVLSSAARLAGDSDSRCRSSSDAEAGARRGDPNPAGGKESGLAPCLEEAPAEVSQRV
jgi:hypothetical protein